LKAFTKNPSSFTMPRKTSKDLTGTNRILFVKEHRNLIVSEQLIISLKALITRAISENILVIHPNAEACGLSGQGIVKLLGTKPLSWFALLFLS
jgi:hypothetical protein